MRTVSWLIFTLTLALSGGCEDTRAAAQPAPTESAAAAALGKAAPDFTLTDLDGKSVHLADLRGKLVVLEWFNPDCPFVKHAHGKGPLTTLAKDVAGPDLVWLSINSGAAGKQGHGVERNRAARGEYGIANTILLDESGQVGRSYGAQKTPHLFIVDKRGVLVYRGGLDNAPMGVVDPERPLPPGVQKGALAPYARRAIDELRAEKPVTLADTPAYGCSVKYGS